MFPSFSRLVCVVTCLACFHAGVLFCCLSCFYSVYRYLLTLVVVRPFGFDAVSYLCPFLRFRYRIHAMDCFVSIFLWTFTISYLRDRLWLFCRRRLCTDPLYPDRDVTVRMLIVRTT